MGVALGGKKTMTDEEIIARAKELGMVENTVLSNIEEEDAQGAEDNANGAQQNLADAQDGGQQQAASDDVPDTAAGEEIDNASQVLPETKTEADGQESDAADEEITAPEAGEEPDVTADAEADEADEEKEEATVTSNGSFSTSQNGRADGQAQQKEQTQQNVNEIITSAAVKTITIKSGDGSFTVAKKLADVGVVTSAETFDTFLCENGYDKRLRTGTFSIPADASDEQIARIVTGAE